MLHLKQFSHCKYFVGKAGKAKIQTISLFTTRALKYIGKTNNIYLRFFSISWTGTEAFWAYLHIWGQELQSGTTLLETLKSLQSWM